MHHFTVGFLEETAAAMAATPMFHVAHKKIPSKNGDVQVLQLLLPQQSRS